MSIDWGSLLFPKSGPRVVDEITAKRDAAREERLCRAAVDARDKRRCFFPGCNVYSNEKHHIVSSSVRGKRLWKTDDILSCCHQHHSWFKGGLIRVEGNPDRGPVTVKLTALGVKAKITIPERRS